MAPLIMMDHPDTDPDPLITHGDMGEIWRPNWTIDPDTGLPVWSGTWEIRQNNRRANMSSIDNLFINRIRALAKIWQTVLTDAQRAVWKINSAAGRGERPGMKGPASTGWNLFAQVGLMLVGWAKYDEAALTTDNPADPDAITFVSATASTGLLSFAASFSGPPWSDPNMFAFIHQVNPQHVDRRDWSRRTIACGYYRFLQAPAPWQPFTGQAVYPFSSGDKVQVLLRLHKSLNGVTNLQLQCTAT